MLRSIALLSTLSLCLVSTLSADADWKVKGMYNHIANAKFDKPDSLHHDKLDYAEECVLGTYKHRYTDSTGFKYGIGYQGDTFHFSDHPKFSQKHFNNLLLRVGAYTKDIEQWKWSLDLVTKTNTEHFDLSHYTFFTGKLKGKYAWHEKRNLYAGILTFMGMRYSRALPIIGFDYTPNERWKFNAIFPLKMNVEYNFARNWSAGTGIRYFLARERTGKDDKLKRGLIAYRNWGLEAALNYQLNKHIIINAHVGESFGGRMRISNKHDRHRKHLRLGLAPYFGFAAEIAF